MKKIFTTILLAASASFAFGQGLRILDTLAKDITGTTYVVNIEAGYHGEVHFGLHNPTKKDIQYKILRVYETAGVVGKECGNVDLDEVYFSFCTGEQCYGSVNDMEWMTPDIITIKAGETLPDPKSANPTFGITSDYGVCPLTCDALNVRYKIFSLDAGVNDTTTILIKYNCSNGIKEEKSALGSVSEAYPNPTSNEFALNYKINTAAKSEIVIFDVCGKRIKETNLADKEGTVKISTSQFVPGIYFYSLIVNNQTVITKKLIVQGS